MALRVIRCACYRKVRYKFCAYDMSLSSVNQHVSSSGLSLNLRSPAVIEEDCHEKGKFYFLQSSEIKK